MAIPAHLRLRLLRVADTLAPGLLNRLKDKVEAGEDLTPREKRLLQRLQRDNKVSPVEEPGRRVPKTQIMDVAQPPGTPEPPKEKRRVAPTKDMGVKNPTMNLEREKIREVLESQGIDTGRLSEEEVYDLAQKIKQNDPLASDRPDVKLVGEVQKLRKTLKSTQRGIPEAYKALLQAKQPGLAEAAKKLVPVLNSLMAPVKAAIEALNHVEEGSKGIGSRPRAHDIQYLKKDFQEAQKFIRQHGSQINEDLQSMRSKYQDAAAQMKKVLIHRFREGVKSFQERGMETEQSYHTVARLPIIRKMKQQTDFYKGVADGLDFMMEEFRNRFIETLKAVKPLKNAIDELSKNSASGISRAASRRKETKRVRKGSKRLAFR